MHRTLLIAAVFGAGSLFVLQAMASSEESEKPEKSEKSEKPEKSEKSAVRLESNLEKASYAIGLNIGRNVKNQIVDVDSKALLKGLEHALAEKKPLLTQAEMGQALQAFQTQNAAKQAERSRTQGAANEEEGEEFLATNKEKEGVKTLPSGLQYKVLRAGTGETPDATDTVTVHYRGTLIDGTEFDSSYARGEPATFRVDGVIKGWTEALQLMPVGSKWELFIPPELAYGERGAGDRIGPNATLIFEVELLTIEE